MTRRIPEPVVGFVFFSSARPLQRQVNVNNKITEKQITARLKENHLPYGILALQNGASVVISQYGGRIFGPFLPPDLMEGGESVLWVNGVFSRPETFQQFLESGDWNLGGDRIWIAPELQYHVRDRADFWGTSHIPRPVDPGTYTLDQPRPGEWRLAQDVELEAYNLATGTKALHIERLIHQVEDPLRNLSNYRELTDGVLFVGYEQVICLSERDHDDLMTEVWSLVQINSGGLLLIPASRRVAYSDYYQPIDASLQTIAQDHVRLKITGDRQYKVGYKAAQVFGRIGYYNDFDNDQACLIVRNFFNNPSAPYAEEPADAPGVRGHSIHVYNDNGGLGGFGELECNGQTIGGETGRSSSTDQLVLWLYVGAPQQVKEIALNLLGVQV